MFNIIIFLLGAGIMFFMALRSVLARRRLCTQGQKVTATVEGTVRSQDGGAYVLAFTTAGGDHRLHYPKPARGKELCGGDTVTLYYDPDDPEKMYVEGDRATLGSRGAVRRAGCGPAGADRGHCPLKGEKRMKLEHFGMAEPGDCRLVFTAGAEELAATVAQVQAEPDAPQEEDGLLTEAVNRTILGGFSALYEQLVREYHVVPVTDPDFELLAVNRAEGFRAGAQFYALPPLEVGAYTGFVQPIEPHPIRQLTIELEINRHHGDEERAADAAGKAALRQQVAREIWAQRCAQAEQRARKELVWQLGDAVKGPLPKQLVGGNYFAEQRQFNLSLQANGINFDQFLKVRGQTVEEFRAWLHAQAERKLRSWLGLLLVAEKEGLAPTDAEVEAAAAHWDAKLDGERTFPPTMHAKVRQRLARERAEQFIVEHSTLTPPPDEPIVQKVESK